MPVSCIVQYNFVYNVMHTQVMFTYKMVSGENGAKALQSQNIYFCFVETKIINKIHFDICQNATRGFRVYVVI